MTSEDLMDFHPSLLAHRLGPWLKMGDKIEEPCQPGLVKGVAKAKWLFREQLLRPVAVEGALMWEEGAGAGTAPVEWGVCVGGRG